MTVFSSCLPNDEDMNKALGSFTIPCPIPCGDVNLWGKGPNDSSISICIERKKPGDLSQCIFDGRYLHQAQSAKDAGFAVLILIVEGEIRCCPDDGLLEIKVWGINPKTLRRAALWQPVKPTITYSRFDQYLTELDYLAGVMVKRSADVRETAAIIKALWDNFQTPPEKHNSLRQIYTQPPPQVQLTKPSLVRRVAAELPGIGWERSKAVAERFPTVRAMAEAGEATWREIEGVGKVTAEKVVRALNGGNLPT